MEIKPRSTIFSKFFQYEILKSAKYVLEFGYVTIFMLWFKLLIKIVFRLMYGEELLDNIIGSFYLPNIIGAN